MFKFVYVFCIAVALLQPLLAFKVVTIEKAPPISFAASSSHAANPPINATALIQSVQTAIAGKLQQVQALLGSVIQQKTALKQNALNSIQSTLSSFKSQMGSQAANVQPPFVIRKHIYVGVAKPTVPDATTSVDTDDATTASG